MINTTRNIVKILKEIAEENDILINTFSSDWGIKLNNKYIIGYNFDINSAAASNICNDKSSTYEILNNNNILAVEHNFFMSPRDTNDISIEQNYNAINLLLKKSALVLKPNMGTGGEDIFLVQNEDELKEKLAFLYARYQSIAVSPYVNIKKEYRVIILNDEIKLIFSKNLPNTTRCKSELVKFNLCHGAIPEIVNDKKLINELSKIAIKATAVIGINFASVDIVEIKDEFKVLEINSGVMMEHFSRKNEEYYKIAKAIYKDAVDSMLYN